MKKLLIYLILVGCFETFISATPDLSYHQKKPTPIGEIDNWSGNEPVQQEDINNEIHPLNIFSFRIN